jgi:hypothetical protein
MGLFKKAPPNPEPLLSEAEMARLHEEIFDEPVSVERLFAMYEAVRGVNPDGHEWVMDRPMFNRIRRICFNAEGYPTWSSIALDAPVTLIGLPVVVEQFANLAIRERVRP